MSPATRMSSRRKDTSQVLAGKKRRALKDVSNKTAKQNNGGERSSKRLRSGVAVEKKATVKIQRRAPPKKKEAVSNDKDNDIHEEPVVVEKNRRRSTRLRKSTKPPKPVVPSSDVVVDVVNTEAAEAAALSPDNRLIGSEYQYKGTVDLMDERDKDDPSCACTYVHDMYDNFREKEVTCNPGLSLSNQPEIGANMRAILVDWLVEVHLKFRLVPETLYLTVNIADRYLSRKEVTKKCLQLVGVTSLMIAAKYEEIYPMGLDDLVYICDRAYTRQDLLDMEYKILRALNYGITIPTAHSFLVRFLKAAHADKRLVQISCMVLDSTLISYNLLGFLPSQLAAASIAIARHSVGRNIWSPTLLKYAYYSQEEIEPVARALLVETDGMNPDLRSVHKKYASARYGAVADTTLRSLDD